MTDQQPTQPDLVEEQSTDVVDSPVDEPDTSEPESANSEAARYRTRLRDAEAERDALAARLANMQRAQIDSHITALGLKPAAVWASGTELADLVDDDGIPDEQAVAAAVENARDHLGLRISKGNVIPGHRPPAHAATENRCVAGGVRPAPRTVNHREPSQKDDAAPHPMNLEG